MITYLKVGDLIESKEAEVQTGPFGTQLKASEYVEEGVPVINVRNIGFGHLREGKLEYLNDQKAKKLKAHTLEVSDIVFGRKGAVERHIYVQTEQQGWIQGSDCLRLRFKTKNVLPKYVSYYFMTQGHKDWMENLCSFGATMTSLNHEIISRIQIPLPDLPTQQRIAGILSAYDELIEVNNQRIRLLEDTVRQLYKEWFVRLRFPGYEQTKFVKGLPEGWEVKTIAHFGKVLTGKTPSTSIAEYYNGDVPFIKTPDMHDSMFVMDTSETLSEKGRLLQKRITLPKNSICVSCIGTGGVVAITTANQSQTNQQINSIVLSEMENLEFLYFSICALKEQIELFGNTGTTMTNLSKGKFEVLKLRYPSLNLIKAFHHIAKPIFNQLETLQSQNTQLRQIRDRLLPRLISGKLSVEAVER